MVLAMSDVTPPSEPPAAGPPPPPPPSGWPPRPASEEAGFIGEPTSPKRRVGRILGIALALAFVLTAGSVAVALFALRGSPETLSKMVPADVDVYLSVNLDPGLGQKAAAARLASKFPSLRPAEIRKNLENVLDQMVRSVSSDLSFRRDVEPWLGSQVAVIGRAQENGDVAVLVASKDDGAAEAALARAVSHVGTHWSTTVHAGVTVHVGSRDGAPAGAYALVNHAVVFGSSKSIVESVIDADTGTSPRLTDTASYKQTVASLPASRLALVYVKYPSLVKSLRGASLSPGLFGSVSGGVSLDAYRGLGIAVSAESAGLALDVSIPLDRSKLSPDDLATLSDTRDARPLLAWVPARAFAFVAGPRAPARVFLQTLENTPGLPPGIARELRRLGVTGPNGLETHLTGDLVIEGSQGVSSPAGAMLIGTDDEAVMNRTLERVARLLTSQTVTGAASGRSTAPTSQGYTSAVLTKRTHVRWATLTHDGVSIRYLASGGPPGLRPAYAVTRGMGIIASSPEELEAVLDTKAGGPSVAQAPGFVAALSHGGSTEGDIVYLDIGSLVSMLEPAGSVPGDLAPLRTLIVTDHSAAERISERLFLSIK
jgi:hypothetical protein